MHRLRRVDTEQRQAICEECGPVKLRSRGNGQLRCANAANTYKRDKRAQESVAALASTELKATTPCCGHKLTVPGIGDNDQQRVEVACACGTWYLLERERHETLSRNPIRDHLEGRHQEIADFLTWGRAEDFYIDGKLVERRHAGDHNAPPWE